MSVRTEDFAEGWRNPSCESLSTETASSVAVIGPFDSGAYSMFSIPKQYHYARVYIITFRHERSIKENHKNGEVSCNHEYILVTNK